MPESRKVCDTFFFPVNLVKFLRTLFLTEHLQATTCATKQSANTAHAQSCSLMKSSPLKEVPLRQTTINLNADWF